MADAIVPQIVLTHPRDPRLALVLDYYEHGDANWESSGNPQDPIYIVIPQHASEEALSRLAKHFSLSFDELLDFRDDYRLAPYVLLVDDGMSPRYPRGSVLWIQDWEQVKNVDPASIRVGADVLLRLRDGRIVVRQVSAITGDAIEVTGCWREDRVTIALSDVTRIDIPCPAGRRKEEFAEKRLAIARGGIPGWIRHQQLGRPFLGPDNSRDPWPTEEQSAVA